MLSKRQESRSKHGPETVIADPPSNGARLGESVSGPASSKQQRGILNTMADAHMNKPRRNSRNIIKLIMNNKCII